MGLLSREMLFSSYGCSFDYHLLVSLVSVKGRAHYISGRLFVNHKRQPQMYCLAREAKGISTTIPVAFTLLF